MWQKQEALSLSLLTATIWVVKETREVILLIRSSTPQQNRPVLLLPFPRGWSVAGERDSTNSNTWNEFGPDIDFARAHSFYRNIQRERKREREQTKRQVLCRRSKKRDDRIEEDTRTSKIFLHSALDSSLESATESASDLHPPWLRSWIHEKKFWGKISGKRDRWKIENQNSFWNNTYWWLNQQYNWYSFIQWRK